MLPANLTTNEVKNAAGTEEQFLRLRANERTVVFAKDGELPNLPHRLTISHTESGVGVNAVRRSLVRVDKTIAGVNGEPVTISKYTVDVIPIGNIANYTEVTNVNANLLGFIATTGAATTVLFDGTGYGAAAAINGGL